MICTNNKYGETFYGSLTDDVITKKNKCLDLLKAKKIIYGKVDLVSAIKASTVTL